MRPSTHLLVVALLRVPAVAPAAPRPATADDAARAAQPTALSRELAVALGACAAGMVHVNRVGSS